MAWKKRDQLFSPRFISSHDLLFLFCRPRYKRNPLLWTTRHTAGTNSSSALTGTATPSARNGRVTITSKPAFLEPNRDDAVWQKVVKARRLYQLAVLNDWRFVLLHSRQK